MAKTPKDELELAAMIAEAEANGWEGTTGQDFQYNYNGEIYAVCAVGAKRSLNGEGDGDRGYSVREYYMYRGNDDSSTWGKSSRYDDAESIGWAFRCAMDPDA